MKNKKACFFVISVTISLLFTGCSHPGSDTPQETASAASSGEQQTAAVLEGELTADANLPGGTFTVPSYLSGSETDTFPIVEEAGDSITYLLDQEQQAEVIDLIADRIQDSINQVLADKDFYPNITGIAVNEDCSEFNVTFSGAEPNTYETTLRMSLYISGDKYQLYLGHSEDAILTTVNYINDANGEIFLTGDSGSLH